MSFPLYLFYLKQKTTRSLLISLIAPLRPTGYGIIYELLSWLLGQEGGFIGFPLAFPSVVN